MCFHREQAKPEVGNPLPKPCRSVVPKVSQLWRVKESLHTSKDVNDHSKVLSGAEVRYEAKKEEVEWLKKATIGEVINPGNYVRCKFVLLEGGDDDDFQGYIEEAIGWLLQWFKELKP